MGGSFEELVNASLKILNSEFYSGCKKQILNQMPMSLNNHCRGYEGILSMPDLVRMAQLNGTFNFMCSGLSYVRMHTAYVKYAKNDLDLGKKALLTDVLTSNFITYGSLFDGPYLCLTHSEDMHLALNGIQNGIHKDSRFSVYYSRDHDETCEANPMGSVHPLKSIARRCISYMSSSPIVVISDLSYVFELCRIWDYPLQKIVDRISVAVEKKLKDIGFEVRIDCKGYTRHKSKLEFDRAAYLRTLSTVYIPFPGIIVSSMGFPIVKTEFLNDTLLPKEMFEWSARQFAAYDTAEKIASFRANGENYIPVSSL